jgi:hypothetical protein
LCSTHITWLTSCYLLNNTLLLLYRKLYSITFTVLSVTNMIRTEYSDESDYEEVAGTVEDIYTDLSEAQLSRD